METIKLAIHHRPRSFSDRWIAYCEQEAIDFKIVNCYDTDIIRQLKDCKALIWHHHHGNFKDVLAAKPILFALEHAGVKVFPDFKTAWHFDNKVAQKYLLEAFGAPLVPSFVFYDKAKALEWAKTTDYPKVFKLKGGAGSLNVSLVRSKSEAIRKINRAFGKGFSQFNAFQYAKDRFKKWRAGRCTFGSFLKGFGRIFFPPGFSKLYGREKGYVYFQEFIPNLDSDVRIQVIGKRICGLKRFVRRGDFRASGSGDFVEFNEQNADKLILKIAVELNKKLKSQSLTIDFIYKNNVPLIVELSYGFPLAFYDNCQGFWDSELNWHEGKFNPQEWMVKDLVNGLDLAF